MTPIWRAWVVVLIVGAVVVSGFGMGVGKSNDPWPIAGLWVAALLAPYGLSVWVAICLTVLGVSMDFMTEAPLGAWPLALLAAYGVALLAWEQYPPYPLWLMETIAVIGGMVAAGIALATAASISENSGFAWGPLLQDFAMTGVLYIALRFFLLPASVREQRQ
ncbi:MAG: hypothetical protein R3C52_06320 [Hyphomonadaceae bacterium]